MHSNAFLCLDDSYIKEVIINMNPTEMISAGKIFLEICGPYEYPKMVRDDVETKWVMTYQVTPTKKQIETLENLFWTHHPEDCTFSRYF